jgi:hypothetical protein
MAGTGDQATASRPGPTMPRSRRWLAAQGCLLAIGLAVLNLATAAWALQTCLWWTWVRLNPLLLPSSGLTFYTTLNDGYVITLTLNRSAGSVFGLSVPRTSTWLELVALRGPLVVSVLVTLAVLGVVSRPRWQPLLGRISRLRLTMFQAMAAIGAISVGFWLSRLGHGLLPRWILVLACLTYALRRRRFARAVRAERARVPFLERAGLAGYGVAAILAAAWLIAIFAWDVLMQAYLRE